MLTAPKRISLWIWRSTALLCTLLCVAHLFGCSPAYVARAAYEEARILWNRESIAELLQSSDLDSETRNKLARVLEARDFAPTIGLNPAETFTAFSDVGRGELAWVLMGARRDSFTLHGWWFPIVGSVPYKGFFDKSDAEEQAKELEQRGYETRIRPTDAFSTLGWFNDPLLSTTLRRSELDVVTTVLHEIVHSTLWFPGHVAFNESLAQFVGVEAAVTFYRQLTPQNQELLAKANINREAHYFLSVATEKAYNALAQLYQSKVSSEQKISQRQSTYESALQEFFNRFPEAIGMKSLNNAALMQQRIYLTGVPCLRGIFHDLRGDWTAFWGVLQNVHIQVTGSETPYTVLHTLYPQFCDNPNNQES
jgi:predicted aminopeptidase